MKLSFSTFIFPILCITVCSQDFENPLWPENSKMHDAGGTRYAIRDFGAVVPADKQTWRLNISPWTQTEFEQDVLGTFQRGQFVKFSACLGEIDTKRWGAFKSGLDGGTLKRTIHWMDEDPSTGKLVEVDCEDTLWTKHGY